MRRALLASVGAVCLLAFSNVEEVWKLKGPVEAPETELLGYGICMTFASLDVNDRDDETPSRQAVERETEKVLRVCRPALRRYAEALSTAQPGFSGEQRYRDLLGREQEVAEKAMDLLDARAPVPIMSNAGGESRLDREETK